MYPSLALAALIHEKVDADERIARLRAYMLGAEFNELLADEQRMLVEQLGHLMALADVLGRRAAALAARSPLPGTSVPTQ